MRGLSQSPGALCANMRAVWGTGVREDAASLHVHKSDQIAHQRRLEAAIAHPVVRVHVHLVPRIKVCVGGAHSRCFVGGRRKSDAGFGAGLQCLSRRLDVFCRIICALAVETKKSFWLRRNKHW